MKNLKRSLSVLMLVALIMSFSSVALAAVNIRTVGTCNLRTGPGLFYSAIRTIGSGVNLTATASSVDERGVTWYKVKVSGKTGWVSSVYCKKGYAPSGKNVVIATGSTYIRAKANKTSAKLGVLSAGYRATYLNKSSVDSRGVRWYKVSYGGVTGWVSSKNSYLG